MPSSINKRIAKNTMLLYIRMLFATIVGLYTSRVVLATLGVEDYGIYGVTGSFIVMMSFLNASMSAATSRFITYELGKGNYDRLQKTFSSALVVHCIIALFVFFVAETFGLWLLSYKLTIPPNRMFAAHCIYQLSVISAMVNITQAPYNATIIAHERMDVYAYVEILHVLLKLAIVYLLLIGNFDKLILYGILTLAVSVLILSIYRVYCLKNFKESKFHWTWEKQYLAPMLTFSGWNIYYEASFAARQQGANFLLNIFCGLVYNAASGIASTVQGIILGFSSNIAMAFRPQVIKSYATEDFINMNKLIRMGSKFAAILLCAVTIPILFKTEYILELWLEKVPNGSVFMVQALLVVNVVNTLSLLLVTGIQASGDIKKYSCICGSTYLFSLLIMYVLLKLGYGYYCVYIVIAVTSVIVNVIYAILLKKQISQFEIKSYYLEVVFPMIAVVALSSGLLHCSQHYFADNFVSLIIFCIVAISIITITSFLFALNKSERKMAMDLVKTKIFHK